MIENDLLQLGFSRNVAKIYLSLVRHPKSARAGEVIIETGLQRSVVYGGLKELKERGLITEKNQKGVLIYSANNASALVHENEKRLQFANKVAESLVKEESVKEREVIILEGDDVIKRVAEKSLEIGAGDTVYFLGSSKFGGQAKLESYWRNYHKRREEKGILSKILYDNDADQVIVDNRNLFKDSEAKYMPFGSDMPMWYCIFGDFVCTIVPSEDPPFSFFIRSKKTAAALKQYFDYLWERGSVKQQAEPIGDKSKNL